MHSVCRGGRARRVSGGRCPAAPGAAWARVAHAHRSLGVCRAADASTQVLGPRGRPTVAEAGGTGDPVVQGLLQLGPLRAGGAVCAGAPSSGKHSSPALAPVAASGPGLCLAKIFTFPEQTVDRRGRSHWSPLPPAPEVRACPAGGGWIGALWGEGAHAATTALTGEGPHAAHPRCAPRPEGRWLCSCPLGPLILQGGARLLPLLCPRARQGSPWVLALPLAPEAGGGDKGPHPGGCGSDVAGRCQPRTRAEWTRAGPARGT